MAPSSSRTKVVIIISLYVGLSPGSSSHKPSNPKFTTCCFRFATHLQIGLPTGPSPNFCTIVTLNSILTTIIFTTRHAHPSLPCFNVGRVCLTNNTKKEKHLHLAIEVSKTKF